MESSPHMYDGANSATRGGGGGGSGGGSSSGSGSGNSSPTNGIVIGAKAGPPAGGGGGGGGPSAPSALRVKNFKGVGSSGNGGPPATTGELAELTSTEISLDLQGLIDDTNFGDDNLFGDLIDAKKNELNQGYGLHTNNRTSPAGSLGSSGHSSPGGGGHDSPPSNYPNYRNALAYLPGSVHSGVAYQPPPQAAAPQPPQQHSTSSSSSSSSSSGIQVKQEPVENYPHPPQPHPQPQPPQASSFNSSNNNNNNNNTSAYSNGTVSSTTPGMTITPYGGPVHGGGGGGGHGGVLPSLKSFATPPKYMQQGHSSVSKKKVDRNSEEYRRRRERNNVAVRKSREKAKARTKDTEDRVKILARDNERLQKKVELLQEELSVLRSLFSNVGVLPEHIHRELSKHMDNFQQQHNAMACM